VFSCCALGMSELGMLAASMDVVHVHVGAFSGVGQYRENGTDLLPCWSAF
jgi:hypothetical protein